MKPDAADFSTDEIVAQIRKGDVEAYRQIVVRYQGEVLKIVNAMLIDYSAREDVVQQVFVRAFQALDQYEIGRGFGKWVKAIARNMVREELRKRYRYKGRIEAYAKSVIERLDGVEANEIGKNEEIWLRRQALGECLGGLEESAAEAVRLHYLERKKTEEIAGVIGKSAGAVRTLLYRARGQLRKCMESKGVLT
tara:strand:- start:20846 stop:21427 length:582 start_codon:yes stop_codon:yes gene_type:complete